MDEHRWNGETFVLELDSNSDEELEDGVSVDEQIEQGNDGFGDDDGCELHYDASESLASYEDVS